MRLPMEPLERVAAAVGRSCYWWNSIEFTLSELCINLARFHDRQFEVEQVWNVLTVALSHMDARQRIAVAKVLAAQGIDPDLYGEVETLLNVIDGELRNERNRFVHDQWDVIDERIVRRKHGARVVRPQSRMIDVSYSTDKHYASADDVDEFSQRVETALRRLIAVNNELTELYAELWPSEEERDDELGRSD